MVLVWIPFVDWVFNMGMDVIVITRLVVFGLVIDVGVVVVVLVKILVED